MQGLEHARLRETILIVDDKEINRVILHETFKEEYRILEAEDGQQALDYVLKENMRISAILLDIVMPVMDGMEFLRKFNQIGLKGKIPVFLITADASEKNMYEGYQLGVMDIIEKPIVPYFVKQRVQSVLELYRTRKQLRKIVQTQSSLIKEQEEEITQLNYAIIESLSSAIEFRSGESGSHVKRIRVLTKFLLMALREAQPEKYVYSDEEIEIISRAAIMHDVGKISISDAILNKPGRLTEEEFEQMKTHTVKGCELIEMIPKYQGTKLYQYAHDICRHHHERWDGRGYPDGLKGNEISMVAQVVSVADVYDALTTKRVYKDAYSKEQALDMIYSGKCGVFNPELLEAARPVLESYIPTD